MLMLNRYALAHLRVAFTTILTFTVLVVKWLCAVRIHRCEADLSFHKAMSRYITHPHTTPACGAIPRKGYPLDYYMMSSVLSFSGRLLWMWSDGSVWRRGVYLRMRRSVK